MKNLSEIKKLFDVKGEHKEVKEMRYYRVDFTEVENSACYTGEWYTVITEADSYVDAFDNIKQSMIENEMEPEEFIFRAKTDEDTEWVYD